MGKKQLALLIIACIALIGFAGADDNQSAQTAPANLSLEELKNEANSFISQVESVLPYNILFGITCALGLFVLFFRGANSSHEAFTKLGGIIVVLFLLFWVLGVL